MYRYGILLGHCGLMTPYDDTDLSQYWFMWWLAAIRHQASTQLNLGFSLGSVTFTREPFVASYTDKIIATCTTGQRHSYFHHYDKNRSTG